MDKISVFKFCLFTAMVYCAILSIGGISMFVNSLINGYWLSTTFQYAILATIQVTCVGILFDIYQTRG